MLTLRQARDILKLLGSLPEQQVREVEDFILFLRDRYGPDQAIDDGEAWNDEDVRDLVAAALSYADRTVWSEEG